MYEGEKYLEKKNYDNEMRYKWYCKLVFKEDKENVKYVIF